MIYRSVPMPWLERENERLKASSEDTQAQLDYIYMMNDIDPLHDSEEDTEHADYAE